MKSNNLFFVVDNERLPVIVARPANRKGGYSIRLTTDGLKISVPINCDDATVMSYLEKHRRWIAKRHQEKTTAREDLPVLAPGNDIPLLGEWRTLTPANVKRPAFTESAFLFPDKDANESGAIAIYLVTAYIEVAANIVRRLIVSAPSEYKQLLREVRLKELKSRWGSCSSSGNVSISWRVVMASPYVFEYLFAHEICHLKHRAHNADFWRAVAELAPCADDAKRVLRSNHYQLTHFPFPPKRPVTFATFSL